MTEPSSPSDSSSDSEIEEDHTNNNNNTPTVHDTYEKMRKATQENYATWTSDNSLVTFLTRTLHYDEKTARDHLDIIASSPQFSSFVSKLSSATYLSDKVQATLTLLWRIRGGIRRWLARKHWSREFPRRGRKRIPPTSSISASPNVVAARPIAYVRPYTYQQAFYEGYLLGLRAPISLFPVSPPRLPPPPLSLVPPPPPPPPPPLPPSSD